MITLLTAFFLVVGASFALVAALGLVRMPDVFMRMHAATKAGTLGASLVLLAAAFHADDLGVVSRVVATILFLFLTAPVAGHVIGRAAYFRGTPLWKGTRADELTGHFDAAAAGAPASGALAMAGAAREAAAQERAALDGAAEPTRPPSSPTSSSAA